MSNPQVSVLMPAYNSAAYIGLAIDSVRVQTYSDWELIIVNDGSTDQTADIVAGYAQAEARIHLFQQPNGGEAAARNTTLDHAQGELLAFLDADDLYRPDHLALAVDYLQRHPEHDAVYTDGYHIDPRGTHLTTLSSRRRGPFTGDLFEQVVRASDVFGPPGCVVVRARPIREYGLRFDTAIGYGTDWDFWARFAAGSAFGYIDQATYLYRIHPGNLTLSTLTDSRRRAWVACRTHAIHMERFAGCSVETRQAVFYDLLINLLGADPAQQMDVIQWPQFAQLPAAAQALLLRLMASQAIVQRGAPAYIRQWLAQCVERNPQDRRGRELARWDAASPALCRLLLRARVQLRRPVVNPSDQSLSQLAKAAQATQPDSV
jgi:hypothetical protein